MADEILWQSRIRPQRSITLLDEKELKELFRAVKRVSRSRDGSNRLRLFRSSQDVVIPS